MNLFAKQKQRPRRRKQTYGYQGGKTGGKASLQTVGFGEGKYSVHYRQEEQAANAQRPKLPDGLQAKDFKDSVGVKVAGCVISSWALF